jgi:hypothetical protein
MTKKIFLKMDRKKKNMKEWNDRKVSKKNSMIKIDEGLD